MTTTEWKMLGPVANYDQLAAICQAICGHMLWFWLPTPDGKPVRSRTKLMGTPQYLLTFDHDYKRYIEQNPHVQSETAKRVRRACDAHPYLLLRAVNGAG